MNTRSVIDSKIALPARRNIWTDEPKLVNAITSQLFNCERMTVIPARQLQNVNRSQKRHHGYDLKTLH